MNDLKMIWSGGTKILKNGQLKYDNVYLMNNTTYNLLEELLEKVLDDENEDDENIVKVLLLTANYNKMKKKFKIPERNIDEK